MAKGLDPRILLSVTLVFNPWVLIRFQVFDSFSYRMRASLVTFRPRQEKFSRAVKPEFKFATLNK